MWIEEKRKKYMLSMTERFGVYHNFTTHKNESSKKKLLMKDIMKVVKNLRDAHKNKYRYINKTLVAPLIRLIMKV